MHQRWRALRALGAPLLATCTIGAAVEFCWAAGEAVLVPHLERHRVRQWVVSTIYLANPTLGLWAQPRLGAWSDRINRRVPFAVALSLIALVGITTLLSAIPISKALGLQSINVGTDGDSMSYLAIFLAFLGFGAADISFDCLLIPGRSLLDDMAVPAGVSEEANALFTGFQLSGRLAALLIGSSRWATSGLWGFYKDPADAHFDACFTVSAVVLLGSMLVLIVFVDDRGSTYETILGDSESNSDDSGSVAVEFKENFDARGMLAMPSNHAGGRHSTSDDSPSQRFWSKLDATALLCTVQAAGWVGVCAQSFFWTAWRGEHTGCVDLALQGVVGMITAGLLPLANARFDAASVWCGSELFFHVLMMSTGLFDSSDGGAGRQWTSTHGWIPRLIGALSGINYAVHATNGLLVAAQLVDDPSKRARTIALVNNCLPIGQLATAVTGGAIAQYFGGFQYCFVCYGALGALLTSGVWIVSSRRNLFSQSQSRE